MTSACFTISPPPLDAQRRDLLRDQADQQDHHAEQNQQHRELVTCDCVTIVHTPYAAPSRNAAALIGANSRSGLKMVITFSRIRKKLKPSGPRRILDTPTRWSASIGSNRTL